MATIVVDDDAVTRVIATRILERAGSEVISFPSADRALDWLTVQPHEAELVITDVSMPGVHDGLSLARRVHALNAQVPVIVMSGCDASLGEARSIAGVVAVIAKPFDPDAFLGVARTTLMRRGSAAAR